MNDLVGFLSSSGPTAQQQQQQQQHMAPQTPQTPSSIPDIILTGEGASPNVTSSKQLHKNDSILLRRRQLGAGLPAVIGGAGRDGL